MTGEEPLDAVDARLLLALAEEPRAPVLALAQRLGLSRNTVQARLAKLDRRGALRSFERRIDPAALGYPLSAVITTRVTQNRLEEVAEVLARIPEVVEVEGLSGEADLLVRVVAETRTICTGSRGGCWPARGGADDYGADHEQAGRPPRLAPLLERSADPT